MTDDFVSQPNGYISADWATQVIPATPGTPTPVVTTIPQSSNYIQQIPPANTNPGSYTLFNSLSCLYSQAEFSVRVSANADSRIVLGWEDSTGANGIYLYAPETNLGKIDTEYAQFYTKYGGTNYGYVLNSAPSTTTASNILLDSSANITGRIVWEAGKASFYLSGHSSPYAVIDNTGTPRVPPVTGILDPANRMKFIIRNQTDGTDSSQVIVDYVKIYSSDCK